MGPLSFTQWRLHTILIPEVFDLNKTEKPFSLQDKEKRDKTDNNQEASLTLFYMSGGQIDPPWLIMAP